ncbi:MAG: phosphate ABC transporter permease PstA [Candidatus Eremiobacteraeota bacterium]|nr:phosphate ABC transporter permease PstA [Candidatus Eremiobacteraeota bacterium]MBV8354806.1 phosphate ABC transporter permease PstA [Candidatus Eremiobacteraeota bacterium]
MGGQHALRWRLRQVRSAAGVLGAGLCAALAASALLIIFGYVVAKGVEALNLDFFIHLPRPVGITGGGVSNGIVGTAIIVALAAFLATPISVLAGVYLALFGRGFVAEALRFLADVLSGVPSIVIGLFAYTVLVAPLKHFSAISAAFAFAILMLPIIVRTSEEAIRSVPTVVREGALALGMSVYTATVHVILPAARGAIITGLLLGIARVTGETAPLLFTAFGSQFWETNPSNPMAALALQVFTYAIAPYEDYHRQAWAGALILIVAVFIVNVAARIALRTRTSR